MNRVVYLLHREASAADAGCAGGHRNTLKDGPVNDRGTPFSCDRGASEKRFRAKPHPEFVDVDAGTVEGRPKVAIRGETHDSLFVFARLEPAREFEASPFDATRHQPWHVVQDFSASTRHHPSTCSSLKPLEGGLRGEVAVNRRVESASSK